MAMTMTQKILARHAGLEEVRAGQLIQAKLDLVLGNDITTPVAINEFEAAGFQKVFDKSRIALVMDHFAPNKDIKAATQCKQCRTFARKFDIDNYYDVGDALSRIPGVSRVHDLHVWTLAPGHGAVMAHLCVEKGIDWEQVLSEAQAMLLKDFGLEHVTLQPEWHCAGGCSTTCRQCRKQREEQLHPKAEETASEEPNAFHTKEGLNVLG